MPNYQKPNQVFKAAVARVIKECHTDLKDIPLECVFIDKASGDEMGKLHIKGKLDAYLYFQSREELGSGEQFLVIEIAKDVWQLLDEPQRDALIDHLLCHCELDASTMKLSKCEPDIQEFNEVAARRGKWNSSIKDFARSLTGKLPLVAEPEKEKVEKSSKGDETEEGGTKKSRKASAAAEAGAQ